MTDVDTVPGVPFIQAEDLAREATFGDFGLTVCRMDRSEGYKGVDRMLMALVELPNLRWTFVGDGDDLPRMKRLARELKLEDRVKFLGRVPDDLLSRLYSHCRVFAMPSSGEGLGLVFLEAMARGKPCIGGNYGGTTEVIDPGETGALVGLSHGELIEALRHWWHLPNAVSAGQRALAQYHRRFSYPVFVRRVAKHLRLLQQSVGSRCAA